MASNREKAESNWELDRNAIIDDRKVMIFFLSFIASMLILVTGLLSEGTVTLLFLIPFLIFLVAVLVLVRQPLFERWKGQEKKLLQSRWGTLGVAVLGFGFGALVHNRRGWFHSLWAQLKRLDTSEEWVLVSLFLLGVMLGFFVVRNWSKNQQEFIGSLTAALGAAFLATIVGTLAGNQQATTAEPKQQTLTAEISTAATPAPTAATTTTTPPAQPATAAAAATRPTATPTPAIVRATATTTPANANTPPNPLIPVRTFAFYALGFSLSGVLNLIAFSLLVANYSRTQSRTSRSVIEFLYGSDKAQVIDGYFLKSFVADPNYAKVNLVAALTAYRDLVGRHIAGAMNRRRNSQAGVTSPPASPPASPPSCSDDVSGPFDYYELIALRSLPRGDEELLSPPNVPQNAYEIVYRRLKGGREGETMEPITAEMFRVGISMRWQDKIEYVVTDGEYQQSFPYYGSVAGMALLVKRPIVMQLDKYKKFRSDAYPEGKTPSQASQPRGLSGIDYLSYIVIPMTSSFGKPNEESLGVLHISTKLFAYPKDHRPEGACREAGTDSEPEIFRILVTNDDPKKLEELLVKRLDEFEGYACNLYRQDDPIVKALEKMKDVIIPLLELYKKCRTGAMNQTTTTTTTNTAV
ncbi:MAG: hypothetical protein QOD32_3594 [Pyrinomonadaceae bacterium]|jgi:hypothetical protein|nr:hypothetical protein [Pyrinomonadaceae bacterium]